MSEGYPGFQDLNSGSGEYNAISFLVRQILGQTSTATLVQILKVTPPDDDVAPVGLVDVLPLVNQINGAGEPTPHLTIYGIPYMRLQGGTSAIILDPKVGDIGLCVFADRDISTVKATKAQANPGSRRRFDMADGLYIGGFLNGTPTQYVRFTAEGIELVTPGDLAGTAEGNFTITVQGNATIDAQGDVTVTAGGDASVTAGGDASVDGATVTLAGGGPAIARVGDAVSTPTGPGSITGGSSKATCG